jgi:hypothetical protein
MQILDALKTSSGFGVDLDTRVSASLPKGDGQGKRSIARILLQPRKLPRPWERWSLEMILLATIVSDTVFMVSGSTRIEFSIWIYV